jgi:hypothetical protein
MSGAQRSATDNQYSRGSQPLLSLFTDAVEKNLSAVTIVHRASV